MVKESGVYFSLEENKASYFKNLSDDFWKRWDSIPTIYPENYFSSSCVIKGWIDTLPDDYILVLSKVTLDDNIIGLAFFGRYKKRIAKTIQVSVLSLQRSGIEECDQYWPEYVQPRSVRGIEEFIPQWYSWMLNKTGVDVLINEVIPENWTESLKNNSPNDVFVNIEKIGGGGVCDLRKNLSWSKSVRRACNQTIKYAKFEFDSDINVMELEGVEKEIAIANHSDWHIEKWRSTKTPSGFLNPKFLSMLNAFNTMPERLKVFVAKKDNDIVGINIVLCKERWAGFYLSSYLPIKNTHWHIGTLMHVETSKILQRSGFNFYDFMAGESKYKDQLSDYDRSYVNIMFINQNSFSGKILKYIIKTINRCNIIKNRLL